MRRAVRVVRVVQVVRLSLAVAACAFGIARAGAAQTAAATRLLILQAVERRAPTPGELLSIRAATQSRNADTARLAVRALARFGRPSLVPDILAGLRHPLPEVRAEAAGALALAIQGLKPSATLTPAGIAGALTSAQSALITRLNVDAEPGVRAAVCEALARLPYQAPADAERAENAILAFAGRATLVADRLGLAKGLEAFVRLQTPVRRPGGDVLAMLRNLVQITTAGPGQDPGRDARVRRLALEGLIAGSAADDRVVERAAGDPDAQVRRLAMRAAGTAATGLVFLQGGLLDPAPMVRLEALRVLRERHLTASCDASIRAAADADMNVALVAIDQLGSCAQSADAIAYLERTVADRPDPAAARGWHRHAHALVALAAAAPDRAGAALAGDVDSHIWQMRMYAALAAARVRQTPVLEALARDADSRVADVALAALGRPARAAAPVPPPALPAPTAADMRRLAAPRARITVRDVGRIDIALLTSEAPGTVLRFAQLAQSGYYDGLSFDRLAPNAVVQGGARREGEGAGLPARETGTWPHVRGTVGVFGGTADAQFFINLVDNPRFDQQYTVFGQILNGADVVDRLLEGDVIESIEIVP